MNERAQCFCGHCGQYLRPDEGHAEIIDGELVMLCESCKSIAALTNPDFSYQNKQNENVGVRIGGTNISKTENAGVVLAYME